MSNNINSFQPKNREKWKATNEQMGEFGNDITCFQEPCVNWRRNNITSIYKRILRKQFKQSTMAVTTTPQKYTEQYLPGGTCTVTTGPLINKINKHIYDKFNLGRWSGTIYHLGKGKQLYVINAYRVCKQNVTLHNSLSTYAQQYFIMKQRGIKEP
jgi:hypothetical protein